jgi:type IV secretory pathway TrbL component
MAAVFAWRSSAAELLRVIQGRRVLEDLGWLWPLLCVRVRHGSGWGPGAGNVHRRVEAQPQRGRLAAHAAATATTATAAGAATATATATAAAAATAAATAGGATTNASGANANAAQHRAAESAARHLVDSMRAQHTDETRAVKRSLRFQPSGAKDGAALRRGQMPHVDRLSSIVRLGRVDHESPTVAIGKLHLHAWGGGAKRTSAENVPVSRPVPL